jgi:hypothetical protein
MKLNLPPKLVEKQVCVLVISISKVFILGYKFDALLRQNWPFSPPNWGSLHIIVIAKDLSSI